ncbi:MAG: M14 family zinc carboxypeptidase [Bacteroidales bacterium]
MNTKLYLLITLCFSTLMISAQKHKEWVLQIPDTTELSAVKGVYADRTDRRENVFYVAGQGMQALKENDIDFRILLHPNQETDKNLVQNSKTNLSFPLENYPTYPQYDSIMAAFAQNYPSICVLDTFAVLPSGKHLLMLIIDDQPNVKEKEPEFLYTSTMHGDETGGYIMLLNLIDTLLENYGKVPRITQLVNDVKICINPLANPDGLYAGNDFLVSGATRTNANGVDLNRNFPDPENGQHPDGLSWQQETKAFMALADSMNFTMSSNIHSGAELVNYPWDTWDHTHANEAWWIDVSKEYADTAQAYSPSGYFSSYQFPQGYTNGYSWYSISGGRQDYMNYFHSCREMTLEIVDQKILPVNELQNLWNANKRSLLNYIARAAYGVSGIVTDTLTGDPIKAKVYVDNIDCDKSFVYSNKSDGYYHRYFAGGNYELSFSATGYETKKVPVAISAFQNQNLNVKLVPDDISIKNHKGRLFNVFPNPASDDAHIELNENLLLPDLKIHVYNSEGKLVKTVEWPSQSRQVQISTEDLPPGIYFLQMHGNEASSFEKLIIE